MSFTAIKMRKAISWQPPVVTLKGHFFFGSPPFRLFCLNKDVVAFIKFEIYLCSNLVTTFDGGILPPDKVKP